MNVSNVYSGTLDIISNLLSFYSALAGAFIKIIGDWDVRCNREGGGCPWGMVRR